jgi:hypothetical protein
LGVVVGDAVDAVAKNEIADKGGPGCLNRFSASISGASCNRR